MYKFILAVAVFAVTACSSTKTEKAPAGGESVADTSATDSTTIAAPVEGEAAK